MPAVLLFFLLALLAVPGRAQEKVVQSFDASGPLTTKLFQVRDKWEVRWESPDVLTITLLAPDGTVVAGAAGSMQGSFYEPKGGSYYLQITRASGNFSTPWHVKVVEIDANVASSGPHLDANYAPPQTISGPDGAARVVPSAVVSAPIAPPAPPVQTAASTPTPTSGSQDHLTEDQAHAVVVIKGQFAEGTGFLVRTPDGPTVVTNLHVLAANPKIKILTTTGEEIKTLGLKGASDRDLAMIAIQDNHYTYLDLATDIAHTVQSGDDAITPGNSEGGEVVLNTKGQIVGIGPEKIEFNNPIYHGNSGGPVFHLKSGKVVAVVTQAMKVNINNAVDKASHDNKQSAIAGEMRYFGLRLDTVPAWEPYDWNRFLDETTFLKTFHDQSRGLDSLMNGARYENAHLATAGEDGPPDSRFYLRNERIVKAATSFHQSSTDTDNSQRLDAIREFVMSLDGVADTDMATIQNPANFYSFDRLRAAEEITYRKALHGEIDKIGDKVSDLGH